ncbi:MAG: DUF885 domain-containing protein [Caulobacterales bacterium]
MTRLAAACFLLLLAACGRPASTPQSAFDGRVRDWTADILAESPELATSAGVGEDIAGAGFALRLDDRSGEAMERRRTAAIRRLAELRAIDADTLSKDEAVTYSALDELFAANAAAAQFEFGDFNPLGGAAPYVLNQLDSAYLTLPSFFDTRVGVTSLQDAENYVARLGDVAGAIDSETARLRADAERGVIPPSFIIQRTIESLEQVIGTPVTNQAYVASLRDKLTPLAAPAADGTPNPAARRAQSLITQAEQITQTRIIPAHQRQAQALRAIFPRSREDAGVWRLPEGDAYYRATLKVETTTDLSPEEIHQIGRARVAELTQQLDISLRRMGMAQGSVGERLRTMTADPRYAYADSDEGRAQLLGDVRARVERVMQMAPQWFSHLPRAALEVRRVPAAAEGGAPGAYYDPPSLDGSTPGIYYINLRNLSELTRIDLPTQDYHEAVPGHHFQIALARERADLPLLRRLMSFNAYSEGWALYAEQLADEQDLYRRDPIGHIGYLRWQLWRAARLVVDTGIHAKRWTREQAIQYLSDTTGDTPGVIVSEVERYIVWPGQACSYELGRREIAALRERARNRLGPDFDLRGFHDAVLREGELPFSTLRQQVDAYVSARAAAAR